jgi:GNAT superfamily N-acetyltransferase
MFKQKEKIEHGEILNGLVYVTRKNIKPAAFTLAKAFQEYPLVAFIIPDAKNRIKIQAKVFEDAIRDGIKHGRVYATSDKLEGVAIWFLSGGPNSFPKQRRTLGEWFASVFTDKERMKRLQAFSVYTDEIRLRLAPGRHWYLQILGVDPQYQGKGFSSRLVKPTLALADREGLPCFLDTQLEKNVSLYQHFGFKVVEEGTIPGSNVKSWAMLRDCVR